MKQGLILFAHGAHDARWGAPLAGTAANILTRRPALPLRLAYLGHQQPDLAQAAAELAAEGCTRIAVLPMFIGSGGHLRDELPRLITALGTRHPGVQFAVHPAIGEDARVQQAMAECALATLAPETAA
jgi:sirohydrochlorin cobaltochelatase